MRTRSTELMKRTLAGDIVWGEDLLQLTVTGMNVEVARAGS